MSNIFLIRHGQTDFSQENIVQGQMNVALNSTGIITISKMGDYIAKNIDIDRVFTSDLLRCKQTCKIILDKFPYSVVCKESKQIREINLGIFEGCSMEILNLCRNKSEDYNSFTPEGGESFNQLIERVEKWFLKNMDMCYNTLIITHRGPLSVIASKAKNCNEFEIDSLLKQGVIIQLIMYENGEYRIEKVIEVVK